MARHISRAINQYPFEASIGLAQSPNGDIYYGCYNIYKLDSLNSLTQIVFIRYYKQIRLSDVRIPGFIINNDMYYLQFNILHKFTRKVEGVGFEPTNP